MIRDHHIKGFIHALGILLVLLVARGVYTKDESKTDSIEKSKYVFKFGSWRNT